MIVQIEMPALDEEGRFILEPEGIIETRIKNLRNRQILKFMIKWKNLPAEEASWENEEFIKKYLNLPSL